MAVNSAQLLRQLEPAVRPVAASAPAAASQWALPLEAQSFESLLKLASAGAMRSERAVGVAFDAQPPLEPAQLERLGAAADVAQASGAKRAAMIIDGRTLILDVENRTLLGELGSNAASMVVPLDAAIFVAPADDAGKQSILGPPGNSVMPPQALRQLLEHRMPSRGAA